ncbi:ABC transporter ATP-binding protein [Mahella australiensis]|uniref:ABC transporter related protein n=1 Tax=Mahella australiensis (strain DSM 15567 / CIP 107919 / 50-1 BON) TaxID=697281 RepID=F3ZYH8_MAHA5|nr:ATP-binding cassette domain-containing protein [Mahella australiensis]AEE96720.1 ABC transporter related protein [Mahella australiensis 50-1 BON]
MIGLNDGCDVDIAEGIELFEIKNLKYKSILNVEYLNIPDRKITCIVGESGSGKTTLLRHLNNLISQDSGQILYKGVDIESMNPISLRRQVVMAPQNPVVFNGNVRYNLIIGLMFSEKPMVNDDVLKRWMDLVHLNKGLDESIDKFSGGEKQRLCLARILVLEPEVLLLDEPSSALDEDTEYLVVNNIVTYAKDNGKTVVMVTHSKSVAQRYGDVIITIDKGRVSDVEQKEGAI